MATKDKVDAVAAATTTTIDELPSGAAIQQSDSFMVMQGSASRKTVKVSALQIQQFIPNGPVGPQGPAGPTGPKGDQGIQGIQGNQGLVGPKGDVGPQGNKGEQGSIGPVGPTGPQGEIGETGPQGPEGEQGPKGDQGDDGPQGPIGPQGAEGEQGPTGPQGPEGPTGRTVTVVGAFGNVKTPSDLPRNGFFPKDWDGTGAPTKDTQLVAGQGVVYRPLDPNNTLYGHVFLFTGQALDVNTWVDMGDIVGPQGPAGPKGEDGPQGPQGEKGDEGPQGERGFKGDPGPQGPEGPTGGALQFFTTNGEDTYLFKTIASANYLMVTDNPGKRTCIVLGKDCAPVGASIGITAVGSGDVQILTDGTVDLNTNITGAVLDNNISYTIVQYKANKWALRGANRHIFPETMPCMKLVQPTNGKGAWTPNAAQAGIYNCGDVKPSKVWFYASRVSTGAIADSQSLSGTSLAASFTNLVGGEFYDFYAAYEYGADKKLTLACPPIRYKVQAAFEAPNILTAKEDNGNCDIAFARGNEWQGVQPTGYKFKATCPGKPDKTGDIIDPVNSGLSWVGTIPLGGVTGTWSVQIYLVYGTYGNSPLSNAKAVVVP